MKLLYHLRSQRLFHLCLGLLPEYPSMGKYLFSFLGKLQATAAAFAGSVLNQSSVFQRFQVSHQSGALQTNQLCQMTDADTRIFLDVHKKGILSSCNPRLFQMMIINAGNFIFCPLDVCTEAITSTTVTTYNSSVIHALSFPVTCIYTL